MAKRKRKTKTKKDRDFELGIKRAKAFGDLYTAEHLKELIKIKKEIGTIKRLEGDELELAKKRMGLPSKVTKQMVKRQRKESQIKRSPKYKSLMALRIFINKHLNKLFNSSYTFHANRCGRPTITVIDVSKGLELEHTFIHITSRSIFHPNSFFQRWAEIFKLEDRFINEINVKRNYYRKAKPRSGEWVRTEEEDWYNRYGRGADYNLMSGGFVDVPEATYRKYDMIPAVLCSNEYVFSQEAVRGAGRGLGHKAGAIFLEMLGDYFEQEAKKYPHTKEPDFETSK